MFCPIHASTSGRISLDCSAGPPGHRDQDKTGGEQRGRDQRIGAAVRVVRVGHAAGQAGATPEIGQIESALQREQQVEQDQRARHGLHAEQMLQLGIVEGDAGFGLPGLQARRAPQQQGPDCADQHNPKSDPGGIKQVEDRAYIDLL
jgi:hypothetical protein